MCTAPVLSLFLASVSKAEEDRRLWDDGPLTKNDFRGAVPEQPERKAYTATEIRHDYRYRYASTSGGRVTATLTEIDIQAYIRRDQSWNRTPDDRRLLDHEQGHADNAAIQCLRARIALRDAMRGRGVQAVGETKELAVAALERRVIDLMQSFIDGLRDADADYDRRTLHGLGPNESEWRRVQAETLKSLTEQWEKTL